MKGWQISEVLRHPFFRSVPPRAQPILAPTFADISGRVPLDFTNISIDGDIMNNMRTLWRNRQDGDIVRAIRNKQYVSFVLVSALQINNIHG